MFCLKYDSTCVSLNLPFCLACGNCQPKLDPLAMKRKSKKCKERHKSFRRKCQQYWSLSWTKGKDATEGNILKHNLVRSYLRIKRDVEIYYFMCYNKRILSNDGNLAADDNTNVVLLDTLSDSSEPEPWQLQPKRKHCMILDKDESLTKPPLIINQNENPTSALHKLVNYLYPRASKEKSILFILLNMLCKESRKQKRRLLMEELEKYHEEHSSNKVSINDSC